MASTSNMPCRPAISSMSLGRAWAHDIQEKLKQAAISGFEGIEVFYEDLQYLADTLPVGRSDEGLKQAARAVRSLCSQYRLVIINLQPFSNYDGLKDRRHHSERIEELDLWFELVDILDTDLIQIPASFLPEEETTGDLDVIVADLREVADLGAQRNPPIRFAYESLCFSTHVNTWELCWEVVERVDRPNFGVCLDTYNIAGRTYADPTMPSGMTPAAVTDTARSIQRLISTIDVNKVFFVQVVDAERLSSPLVEGHEFFVEGQPARMSWSRNCRLFYGEQERGGYLPVKEITQAIVNGLGFRGWISMELFNRSMSDPDPSVPREHARRGMASWAKIQRDTHMTAPSTPVTSTEVPSLPAHSMSSITHSEPRMISIL